MKRADREKLKLKKQWVKENPDWREKVVTTTPIYSVDKFYECDGDQLDLLLLLPYKAIRPIELFPEDLRQDKRPMLRLLSCDDSCMTRDFELGEEELAKKMLAKIIEMQPITFDELRELGFYDD